MWGYLCVLLLVGLFMIVYEAEATLTLILRVSFEVILLIRTG